MTARQANLDGNNISDETVVGNFRCFVKGGKRALPGAGLPDDAVSLNSFDDCLLLPDGAGEGFLAVNILLPACSFSGDQCVRIRMIIKHNTPIGFDTENAKSGRKLQVGVDWLIYTS